MDHVNKSVTTSRLPAGRVGPGLMDRVNKSVTTSREGVAEVDGPR